MIELGHETGRKPPFRYAAYTRVGFSDTDAQGVVYYGRYMPYFDRARVEYLRHLGLLGMPLDGREFVMRANRVEYHAPARFDDRLEVFVRTERIGTSSLTLREEVRTERDTALLYVLRNHLGLTGTRFGCGLGLCGACLVLIDGRPAYSCDTPMWAVEDRDVTTVEGLGVSGRPHPAAQAIIDGQAAQCGYCISGVVISAAGLLAVNDDPQVAVGGAGQVQEGPRPSELPGLIRRGVAVPANPALPVGKAKQPCHGRSLALSG